MVPVEAMPDNVARLREMVGPCTLCPRRCGVDRSAGEVGACRVGARAVVASAGAHFGEEAVLTGPGGSGTIFFAGCNLDCVFCQNADISHRVEGAEATPEEIAALAVRLAEGGCENINFVTPTHVSHAVAEAVVLVRRAGCRVPVVYNCGGYELPETLALLAGRVEVYMPDFKYADADAGRIYSGVADYPAVAAAALAEMYRQVGPLRLDARGVATGGLLVRHLVMPGDLAGGAEVIDTVARVAPGCAVNVMGQYRPAFRAEKFAELCRKPDPAAVTALRHRAAAAGLMRVD